MNRTFRNYGLKTVAPLVLALGALIPITGSKSALADGYFMFDNDVPTSSPTAIQYGDGSAAFISYGQTLTVSSYSDYKALSTSSENSGSANASENCYFYWFNADGMSPIPTHSYDANYTASDDGDTTSAGGATASSSAIGTTAGNAPPAYNNPGYGSYTRLGHLGTSPSVSISASANTDAGPDNTADPQNEDFGAETSAASGASTSVTLDVSASRA